MKALLLTLALLGSLIQEPKTVAPLPNPKITTSYDRFSDITRVTLAQRLNTPQGVREMEWAVVGMFTGRDIDSSIPRVALLVTSWADEWRYLESPKLFQVIIDEDTRVTLGAMKRLQGDVLKGGNGVVEQLILDVPFSQIEKLSKARSLEMRIGPDEFIVTSGQLDNLKDWVRRFPAAQSKLK